MFRLSAHAHRPKDIRPIRTQFVRPTLEGLEDRILLYSTLGGSWHFPVRVTYSFVPDGTSIGGTPSSLFQTFNAVAPTAVWQQAIEKAAAVWNAVANIELVQVSDSGAPIGVAGDQQGDPRFGDIRIGAYPMPSNYLAFTYALPPFLGGTLAGDMFFNSNQSWHFNSDFDLETVAIHEFGHALGMSHSATTQADMYAYYSGVNQALYADDIAGISSIYGAITDTGTNHSFSNAFDLTPYLSNNQVTLPWATIAGYTDTAYFAITVPATTTGTMTVTMQTTNISSLSPSLTLFNSAQQGLVANSAPNSLGATISATVTGVQPGQVYYARLMAANPGPGSGGVYALQMNFGSNPLPPVPPLVTIVKQQLDLGGFYITDTTGKAAPGTRSLEPGQWYYYGPNPGSSASSQSSFTFPSPASLNSIYFNDNNVNKYIRNEDLILTQVGNLVAPGDALTISPRLIHQMHLMTELQHQDGHHHHGNAHPVVARPPDRSQTSRTQATDAVLQAWSSGNSGRTLTGS